MAGNNLLAVSVQNLVIIIPLEGALQ